MRRPLPRKILLPLRKGPTAARRGVTYRQAPDWYLCRHDKAPAFDQQISTVLGDLLRLH